MISKIDTQLSKAENRLVFEMSLFDRIFGFAFNALIVLAFPAITLSYTFQHFDTIKDDLFSDFMGHLVAFGFAYFMYDWVKRPTRLLQIKGKNPSENRLIAKKVIEEMDWLVPVENHDYLIAGPKSHYQKQLTVIFDRKDILLSSLRFGRSEAIMNYHSESAETFKQKFEAHINKKAIIEQVE